MTISFNRLDLNLLRVFDAIMEERNLARASERVSLSQSGVSHALARLREVMNDQLFVRTPNGMQPTPRALSMAPPIREAWKSLHAAITLPKFDARSSTRRFTIAVSDFVTIVMVPRLLQLLRQDAPSVDIVILPDTQMGLTAQIDLGRIDVAIGTFSMVPERFRSSPLFEYDDVLITSSRTLGTLSVETLSQLSIVIVSTAGEQPDGNGFVTERGLARRSEMFDRKMFERAFQASASRPRIAVTLPDFVGLPTLLEKLRMAAIVPRPLAKSLFRAHSISVYELPYPTAHMEVRLLWRQLQQGDTSQEWLHGVLRRATEHLRVSGTTNVTRLTPEMRRRRDRHSPASMNLPSD